MNIREIEVGKRYVKIGRVGQTWWHFTVISNNGNEIEVLYDNGYEDTLNKPTVTDWVRDFAEQIDINN